MTTTQSDPAALAAEITRRLSRWRIELGAEANALNATPATKVAVEIAALLRPAQGQVDGQSGVDVRADVWKAFPDQPRDVIEKIIAYTKARVAPPPSVPAQGSSQTDTAHHAERPTSDGGCGSGVGSTSLPSVSPPSADMTERATEWLRNNFGDHAVWSARRPWIDIEKSLATLLSQSASGGNLADSERALIREEERERCARIMENSMGSINTPSGEIIIIGKLAAHAIRTSPGTGGEQG